MSLLSDLTGTAAVSGRVASQLVRPRFDRAELLRSFVEFGEASIPIVALTAAFTGAIMVLQGAFYVQQLGIYDLVGWYTGFATFREIGPVMLGLMFSGRVGARHASELASMRATEQLDALKVLALDVYELLIVPRVISMTVSLVALVIFGDLIAIASGALTAKLILGLDAAHFFRSLDAALGAVDVLMGVTKAAAFGFFIAIIATHYGLNASRDSAGVGRAVNAQVVASAIGIFFADYVITVLFP